MTIDLYTLVLGGHFIKHAPLNGSWNSLCEMARDLYVTASQMGWVIPDLYLLASVSTEEVAVLVIRYSGHYSWTH